MKKLLFILSFAFLVTFMGIAQSFEPVQNFKVQEASPLLKNSEFNGSQSDVVKSRIPKTQGDFVFEGSTEKATDAITTFPWLENFNATTFPPTEWSRIHSGPTTGNWQRVTTAPVWDGGYAYRADVSGTGQYSFLITPQITLPSTGAYKLQFMSYIGFPDYYYYSSIFISTTVNDDPMAFEWVYDIDGDDVAAAWRKIGVSLMDYAGENIYIAFVYEGDYSHNWRVDDVEIVELPANDLTLNATPYPYSKVPIGQGILPTLSAKATNVGANAQTNVVLAVDHNGTALAVTPTSVASLAAGVTQDFSVSTTAATFNIGQNKFNYALTQNETDVDPTNNVSTRNFTGTYYTYAVDNDVIATYYGATNGNTTFGNIYEFTKPTKICQVKSFHYGVTGTAGNTQTLTFGVYEVTGDLTINTTAVYTASITKPAMQTANTTAWIEATLGTMPTIPAGKYYVCLTEGTAARNMTLLAGPSDGRTAYQRNGANLVPTGNAAFLRLEVDFFDADVTIESCPPFYQLPFSQTAMAFPTLKAKAINTGLANQTDITFSATLNGTLVGTSAAVNVNFLTTSAEITITPQAGVNFPTAAGTYDFVYTMNLAGDENLANNSTTHPLVIGNKYALENLDCSKSGGGSSSAVTLGNIFTIYAPTTLTDVEVGFGTGATNLACNVSLYEMTGATQTGTLVFTKATAQNGAGFVTVTLDTPAELTPGNYFLALNQTGTTNIGVAYDDNPSSPRSYSRNASTGALGVINNFGQIALRMVLDDEPIPACDPVTNLAVDFDSNCVPTITWDAPSKGSKDGSWLTWCDDNIATTFGYHATNAHDLVYANRFTPADLLSAEVEDGQLITKIALGIGTQMANVTTMELRIWEGGNGYAVPGTLVYEQAITNYSSFTEMAMNEIVLTSPHAIDITKELRVGVRIAINGGYPMGCDAGPIVADKGSIFNILGNWYPANAMGRDYNFIIKSWVESGENAQEYNVYRDNVLIAGPIAETSYIDATATPGTQYEWAVAAICDDGSESELATIVKDACEVLEPVTNLTANVVSTTVYLSWIAPGGKSGSKAIPTGYDITFNGAPLATVTTTSYIHTNVAIGTHEYCVVAVYSLGESDEECVNATVDATADDCNPVTDLTVDYDVACQAIISWTAPAGGGGGGGTGVPGSLGTPPFAGSGQGGGVAFDMIAAAQDVSITGIDFPIGGTGARSVHAYYRPNSACGNTASSAGWTSIGVIDVNVTAGSPATTLVEFPAAVTIPAGQTYGFYFAIINAGSNGIKYDAAIGGSTICGNTTTISNSHLTIMGGHGLQTITSVFTSTSTWTERHFCGTVHYTTPGGKGNVIQSIPSAPIANSTAPKVSSEEKNSVRNSGMTLSSPMATKQSSTPPSKGVVYSEGFEGGLTLPTGWTSSNSITGGSAWQITDYLGGASGQTVWANSGTNWACNLWTEGLARDAWLYSSGITLEAGETYNISFFLKLSGFPSYSEYDYFEAKIGQTASVAGMTTELYYNIDTYVPNWTKIEALFTPTTSGTYYLGFHAFTPTDLGNDIDIDDILITDSEPPTLYNVYRDGALVAAAITATSYTDSGFDPTIGHEWTVTQVCTNGESDPATVSLDYCKDPLCEEVQIGTGTTATYNYPINTYYGNSYSQQIFDAADLGITSGMEITSISFQYMHATTITRGPIEIYLGNTSKTEFTNTTDWVPVLDMRKVFEGSVTFSNGWVTIYLDTPFPYTGDNIVLATLNNQGSYLNSNNRFNTHSTTGYKTLAFGRDGTALAPLTNTYTAPATNGATGGRYQLRNNVKFEACPPVTCDVEIVTIGSGTTGSNLLPYNPFYRHTYSQQILDANEIGADGGEISSISFYYIYAEPETRTPFEIYLANTTKTEFANTTDWVPMLDLEQVFSGSVDFNGGWFTINFDTPFYYTGGNLVVTVLSNQGAYTNSTNRFHAHTTTGYKTLHYRRDNDPINPLTENITATGRLQQRNNMQIEICEGTVTCPAPTNIAITYTETTAAVTWTPAAGTYAWRAEIVDFGDPQGSGTMTGDLLTPTYTFNGLTDNTYYSVYVQTFCGGGDESKWVGPISFKTNCYAYDILPFFEGFEGGTTMPDCWTQEHVVGANNWIFRTNTSYPSAPHTGTFNAAFAHSTTGNTTKLVSPKFDFSAVPEAKLVFWHAQEVWSASIADVDFLRVYYKNSPTGAWVLLDEFTESIPAWRQESYTLPNLSATYWVAFEAVDNYGRGVVLDDVLIYAPEYAMVMGVVTHNGNPVENATVNFHGTYVDYLGVTTGASGAYAILNAEIGTYNTNASAPGYNTAYHVGDVVVGGVPVNVINFELTAPDFYVNPDAVTVQTTYTVDGHAGVTLYNDGDGPVDWSLNIEYLDKSGRSAWDLVASIQTNAGGEQGIATDGNYIYTAFWNTPNGRFAKYEMDGTFIENFTIASVGGIRDLTYDGTYFYGGAGATTMYVLDLAGKALVSTFTTPVAVRHCSYDPEYDGFWIGDWTSLRRINRAGVSQFTATVGPNQAYGSAYDNVSAGGPYLLFFCQPSSNAVVYQYDIANNVHTSFSFDFSSTPGFSAGISGGAFISEYAGKICFFGNVQQTPNVIGIYELATIGWLSSDVQSGRLEAGETQNVLFTMDGSWAPQGEWHANANFVGVPGIDPATVFVTFIIGDSPCPMPIDLTAEIRSTTVYEEMNDVVLTWDIDPGKSGAKGINFSTDFEDLPTGSTGIPTGWTGIDADGDGYQWYGLKDSGTPTIIPGHSGTGLMSSASWQTVAFTPNNWLITPQITIEANGEVEYWVSAQDDLYPGEHYGVYISTTGTNVSDFTLLFEETMTAKSMGTKGDPKGINAQGTWYLRTVDLSSYTGDVYIAFRHFNCTDKFRLNLDDVTVTSEPAGSGSVKYNVYRDGFLITPTPITPKTYTDVDLDWDTQYCYAVEAVYDDCISNTTAQVCITIGSDPCAPRTIPYAEGFNDGAIPMCWTQETVSGNMPWRIVTNNTNQPATPAEGTHFALFPDRSSGTAVTKLVSPQFDLSAASIDKVRLQFKMAAYAWVSDHTDLRVYYRLSENDPWIQAFQELGAVAVWTQKEVIFSTLSGTFQFAFEGIQDYGYGLGIDDVILDIYCDPVTNLATVVDEREVTVSWTGTTGAVSYDLYRDNVLLINGTATTYVDANLDNGTYNYCVVANYANGCSSDAVCENAIVLFFDPPTNLQVTTQFNVAEANLTWDAPTQAGLLGYNVYRYGVQINTALVTTTAYVDATIAFVTNYCYEVTAVYTHTPLPAESAPCDRVCILSPCYVFGYPFFEGFENNGDLPSCWDNEYVTFDNDWRMMHSSGLGYTAYEDDYYADFWFGSYTSRVTKLVTPYVDLTTSDMPVLRFWHIQENDGSDQDELKVYYRTEIDGAWTLLKHYDQSVANWVERVILLPEISATFSVAFEGITNYGNGVGIDNVILEDWTYQECGTALTLTTDVDVDANDIITVTLDWIAPGLSAMDPVLNYAIYRDGLFIGYVDAITLTYDFVDETFGTHEYCVRAVYASCATPAACETVITCPWVSDLTATFDSNTHEVYLTWDLGYTANDVVYLIYRDDVGFIGSTVFKSFIDNTIGIDTYEYCVVVEVPFIGCVGPERCAIIATCGDPLTALNVAQATTDIKTVVLSWTAPVTTYSYTGYIIYRDATQIGTVAFGTTTYTDTEAALAFGSTYNYSVAVDYGTCEVAAYGAITLQILPPTNVLATTTSNLYEITISWNAPQQNTVTAYKVYDGNVLIATVAATANAYTNIFAIGSHDFCVSAVYGTYESAKTCAATIVILNESTCEPVDNLTATVNNCHVVLTWDAPVVGYNTILSYTIFRNGTQITTVTNTAYGETMNVAGTYVYGVLVNYSDVSNCVDPTAEVTAVVSMPAVTNFNVTAQNTRVNMTWTAVTGASTYAIYVGGAFLAEVSTTTYSYTVTAEGAFNYEIEAVYTTGCVSAKVQAGVLVNVAEVTNVNATVQADGRTVVVTWTQPVPNVNLTAYKVYRDGTYMATIDNIATTTWSDVPANSGTYLYCVEALYSAVASERVCDDATLVYDDQYPAVTAMNLIDKENLTIVFGWTGNANADSYKVYRNIGGTDVYVGVTTDEEYLYKVINLAASLQMGVTAMYGSYESAITYLANQDMMVNALPSLNIYASLGNVTLTWVAPSDTYIDLVGYIIYRDGVEIGTTAVETLSYVDVPGTGSDLTYCVSPLYGPGAILGGNVCVGHVDPDYCEAVTNLVATQANNHVVELTWTAPADVTNASYNVYRLGVLLGTTTNTFYNDTEHLASGAYTYSVAMVCDDAPGGESPIVDVSITITVGIDVVGIEAKIYPNPANDYVIVECESITNIRIFSNSGQLMRVVNVNAENKVTVSTQELATGVYYFEITTMNGGKISNKVVVNR